MQREGGGGGGGSEGYKHMQRERGGGIVKDISTCRERGGGGVVNMKWDIYQYIQREGLGRIVELKHSRT